MLFDVLAIIAILFLVLLCGVALGLIVIGGKIVRVFVKAYREAKAKQDASAQDLLAQRKANDDYLRKNFPHLYSILNPSRN